MISKSTSSTTLARWKVGDAVVAPEHHALEALRQPGGVRRLEVALRAIALADRALVPLDPEPAQVVEDRLLAPGQVPGEVGVVDAQQHPVAEPPVRDRAERVADVQRAGRARREADACHTVTLVRDATACPERLPRFRDSAGAPCCR